MDGKKAVWCFVLFVLVINVTACSRRTPEQVGKTDISDKEDGNAVTVSENIPDALEQIPDEYKKPAQVQGRIERLDYKTYESFSYAEKSKQLDKTAYVYLPADYDKGQQYNIFYLMHGGWSNETTWLGTPEHPTEFKNILDHAIADGKIQPLIIVCPTYNNTSGEDSADYSLALQLTDQYHQELAGDLIPAVESKYSTFAEDTTEDGIKKSRDHRGFGGFSMGSVTTWHTFQYCLDYFRYFMPMSGNMSTDGEYMADMVRKSGHDAGDFFIYAMSGTDDFAYSAFKSQIEAMAAVSDRTFVMADNEKDGNLAFREQEGGVHDGNYASQYTYNGLMWFWNEGNKQGETVSENAYFTEDSTVGDVLADSAFGDFGRLHFPADRSVPENATLSEVSSENVYVWYSGIQPKKTVEIVNFLKTRAESGEQIFFPIYSDKEIQADASKADTELFYFGGRKGNPFAIMNAGGGFMYVGAMHDSFPHALEVSKKGYNAFALIYRPDEAYEDLARAVTYLYDHAKELEIQADGYSLWGGSAGARMAAVLGNRDYLQELTGRKDIPQASAVIMQYTGYTDTSSADAPTYACVGTSDGIASADTMKSRLEKLDNMGIPTEFHSYKGLPHGFGIGTGTVAEGWLDDAVRFWETRQKEFLSQ